MKYIVVLLYVFSFGIADCLWVNVNRKNHELVSMLCRSIVTTVLFFCLVIIIHYVDKSEGNAFAIDSLVLAIGLSLVCYGGQYFYVKSLKHTSVSLSITLVSILTFLISILVSIIIYHETIGPKVVTLMILTLVGVTLIVNSFHWKAIPTYRIGLRYILLASVCWGLGYSFIKKPIESIGVVNFSLVLETTILFMNLLLFYANGLKYVAIKNASTNSWRYLTALGVLIFSGTIFNSLSYHYFGVATLNIVGKVGIIVPIAYALLFLNDKITGKQALGIFLIITGAVAVSYYGNV